MTILSVHDLSKRYGRIQALADVSFAVPQGSVFGILGPNGSGKTTLLGIIMSILNPTGGSYKWFDETPTDAHRQKIGTLLETPNFYHYLNGERNLRISAAIKGRGENDIDRVLEVVGLAHRKRSAFSTYSLGMKQRLAIGSALLGDPDVLVFDEPTNGLDPVGIAEIRTLIKDLAKQGKTIIMASHLLDEVEKVCTHVAILKLGDLKASGSVNDIFINDDIVELMAENADQLYALAQQMPGDYTVLQDGNLVTMTTAQGTANLEEINRYCFQNGITLRQLHLKKKSLETKFLELTNN